MLGMTLAEYSYLFPEGKWTIFKFRPWSGQEKSNSKRSSAFLNSTSKQFQIVRNILEPSSSSPSVYRDSSTKLLAYILTFVFPLDHWSQATFGPVISWMGDPHSSAIGCCSRAVRGEALNRWVHNETKMPRNLLRPYLNDLKMEGQN